MKVTVLGTACVFPTKHRNHAAVMLNYGGENLLFDCGEGTQRQIRIAKLNPMTSYNHLLNQKFLPLFLEGDNKEAFTAYLRSWCALGIHHIQFNIMDKEAFLDAQEHPENYSDLVVRVAGYAAYFVDLARPLQDEIIHRTEQTL